MTSSLSFTLTLGSPVIVGGIKSGTLRYLGRVHFAEGEWCGVELSDAEGLHDGAVSGVRYFTCAHLCGIFAPRFKVTSQHEMQLHRLLDSHTSSNSLEDLPRSSDMTPPGSVTRRRGSVRSRTLRPRSSSIMRPPDMYTARVEDDARLPGYKHSSPQRQLPAPNTKRPKSALVTSNWSSEQMDRDGYTSLKSNLQDNSARARRTKRVTFDDEYDLAGDDTTLQLTDEELQPRDVHVTFTETKERLSRGRTPPVSNMTLTLTHHDDKQSHPPPRKSWRTTAKSSSDNSFDDVDFDKNLDFEISDVSTPPDCDGEAGLLKLSDESACSMDEMSGGRKEERNNRQNVSGSLSVTDCRTGRSKKKPKMSEEKKRNKNASRPGDVNSVSNGHVGEQGGKTSTLFSDQGLEMSSSFCTSASFELAKTALTQYADLLKAAQADRAKAATRRSRPAGSSLTPGDSATNQGSAGISSNSEASRTKGSVTTYVVKTSKFEDVGLSGSVDSLNSDIVGGQDLTDEEMEFETFDGEELNSVLDTLGGQSSDCETDHSKQLNELDQEEGCEYEGGRLGYDTKNEQVHTHYRLIDNEAEEEEEGEGEMGDLELEDSLTPANIHCLMDKNSTKVLIASQLPDNQGNFTLGGSLTEHKINTPVTCPTVNRVLAVTVEEWQNRVNDNKSMEQITPEHNRIVESNSSRVGSDLEVIQQADLLQSSLLIPQWNTFVNSQRRSENLSTNTAIFLESNLSDSGVLATSSDECGSIWRSGGESGGRQERPMSLVSSASTDDTGYADSELMSTSMAAIDVNLDDLDLTGDLDLSASNQQYSNGWSQHIELPLMPSDQSERTSDTRCMTSDTKCMTTDQSSSGQESVDVVGTVSNATVQERRNVEKDSIILSSANTALKHGQLDAELSPVEFELSSSDSTSSPNIDSIKTVESPPEPEVLELDRAVNERESRTTSGSNIVVQLETSESQKRADSKNVSKESQRTSTAKTTERSVPTSSRGGVASRGSRKTIVTAQKDTSLSQKIDNTSSEISSTTTSAAKQYQSVLPKSRSGLKINDDVVTKKSNQVVSISKNTPVEKIVTTSEKNKSALKKSEKTIPSTETNSVGARRGVNSVTPMAGGSALRKNSSATRIVSDSKRDTSVNRAPTSSNRSSSASTANGNSTGQQPSAKTDIFGSGPTKGSVTLPKTRGKTTNSDVVVKTDLGQSSKSRTNKPVATPMTSSLTNQRAIIGQLEDVKEKLTSAEQQLEEALREKTILVTSIDNLARQHRVEVETLRAEHERDLNEQRDKLSHQATIEFERLTNQYSHEVVTLKSTHDKQIVNLKAEQEKFLKTKEIELAEAVKVLATEHQLQISVLDREHSVQLSELMKRFEEMKKTLSDKCEQLMAECSQQRALEAARVEQATRREVDRSKAACLEADSLRVILEQKNDEIRQFRQQAALMQEKLDEIPALRETISKQEHKMENLEAIVSIKTDHEKHLSEMQQALLRRYDRESKDKNRLSMNNEELQWRLSQSEMGGDQSEVSVEPSFPSMSLRNPTSSSSYTVARMSRSYDGGTDSGRRRPSPGATVASRLLAAPSSDSRTKKRQTPLKE